MIPGSHCNHNPLHDLLDEPHLQDLQTGADMSADDFGDGPDEINVPIQAGDLVIGGARLLHTTHANQSDRRRSALTLWYQLDLRSLPEAIQAPMAAKTQEIPPGMGRRDARQSGSHHAHMRRRRYQPLAGALPAPIGCGC